MVKVRRSLLPLGSRLALVVIALAVFISSGCQSPKGPYETRMENLLSMPRYSRMSAQDQAEMISKARNADRSSAKSSRTLDEEAELVAVRSFLDYDENIGK